MASALDFQPWVFIMIAVQLKLKSVHNESWKQKQAVEDIAKIYMHW